MYPIVTLNVVLLVMNKLLDVIVNMKATMNNLFTSDNSVYLVRACLTANAHPYCSLRSQHQIYANVVTKSLRFFVQLSNS